LRTVGWQFAVVICLPIAGLWIFAKDSVATKIAASVAMLALAGIGVVCICVASAFAVAEIRDDRLSFYFCGIRTRSIALDESTFFELRKIGRLEILRICSNGSRYVPNGALDKSAVVDLLRANGVAEQKAESPD
jgi:hypothetical protein